MDSRFDSIHHTFSPSATSLDKDIIREHRFLAAIFLWHRTCKKIAKEFSWIGQNATEPDFEETFWRALVCNRSDFNQIPGPDIGTSYKAWLQAMEIIMENQPIPFVEPDMEPEERPVEKWIERMRSEEDTVGHETTGAIQDPILRDRQARYENMISQLAPFARVLSRCLRSRRFFISRGKTMGWAPLSAGGKSSICVFQGCRIPFAIEKATDEGYRLLGACYLHGFMDGQLWSAACADWQMITLV